MLLYAITLLETPEDKRKLEKLYYQYRALMKHIALGILRDDGFAEDAVHDAFLKLVPYLDKLEDGDSVKTESFVVTVIRSVSIDRLRKEQRQPVTVSMEEIGELQDRQADVLEHMQAKEVVQYLKPMPDVYRDVLELKAYHALSIQEIAELLDISYAAAQKRLDRARTYLLQAMA